MRLEENEENKTKVEENEEKNNIIASITKEKKQVSSFNYKMFIIIFLSLSLLLTLLILIIKKVKKSRAK